MNKLKNIRHESARRLSPCGLLDSCIFHCLILLFFVNFDLFSRPWRHGVSVKQYTYHVLEMFNFYLSLDVLYYNPKQNPNLTRNPEPNPNDNLINLNPCLIPTLNEVLSPIYPILL
jgi:hypothetical protein